MKTGSAILGNIFETVQVSVWDIKTKKIVFTGSQSAAALYCQTSHGAIGMALKNKTRLKKKWAIRHAKKID